MDLPCFRRADSDDRGRHLRATRFIAKNELIFCERPLVALQSVGNAHSGALVCRNCRAFCGGPDVCLAMACGRVDRAHAYQHWKSLPEEQQEPLIPCRQDCGEVYCCRECEQDHWHCGGHSLLCTGQLPESASSEESMHPLVEFKIHAVQNNEIFLMVADLIASVLSQGILQLEQKHKYGDSNDDNDSIHSLLSPYLDFTLVPWWTVATTPLLSSPMGFAEAAELERVLRRLCDESAALLKRALEQDAKAKQALKDYPELCSADFFGKVIGSFEQNAIGIRSRHPLCRSVFDKEFRIRNRVDLIKCIDQAGMIGDDGQGEEDQEETKESLDTSGIDAAEQGAALNYQMQNNNDDEGKEIEEEWDYNDDELASFLAGLEINEGDGTLGYSDTGQNDDEQEEDVGMPGDDLDALFTPLDGTAMYYAACKMNHSCDPNVVVLYKSRGWGSDHPLVAHCIALRDIEPDEELCISYIQSDEPLEARQKAIANYGFTCSCEKCESEANQQNGGQCDVQAVGKFDNDDLFGEDDDSDDGERDDDSEGEVDSNENGDSDTGEKALRERLALLNKSHNTAPAGAIPLKALATAFIFVVQLRTTAAMHLAEEELNMPFAESIEDALEAVRERAFAVCKPLGASLEEDLFLLLERNGSWPRVAYREAYGCSAVVAAIGYAHEGSFLTAQHMLDKASVLGLPREQIGVFFDYVENHANEAAHSPYPPVVSCFLHDYRIEELKTAVSKEALSNPIQFPVREAILTIESEKFELEYVSKSEPVVIRGFADEWPAVSKWRNVQNLVRDHGHRIVPIEMGSMMESEGMKEKLMTFRHFVTSYLEPSSQKEYWTLKEAKSCSSDIAYLAQHPLMNQIPQLQKDVERSPYLCGRSGPTHVNLWIGSGGTRTPLHFDTYDNLFVQIIGAKYVRIYGTEETRNLYVIHESNASSKYLQGNMSAVDCEMENFQAHPMALEAKYVEVLMLPGDSLYIPARAWHYVRSLSTSISVNYWF